MTYPRYRDADEMRKWHRNYYLRNKEKVGASRRAWRKANPDKVKAQRERRKARGTDMWGWYRRKQDKLAGRVRPERCEIPSCASDKKVVFDHCHKSEKFRGWICDNCNTTLGRCKDNPAILRELADYIERHNVATADDRARNEIQLQGVTDP